MRNSLQRRVTGIDGQRTSHKNASSHNRTGSERHNYQRAEFWCDPANHFWESGNNGIRYTEESKQMYREFIAEQWKIADRQCKQDQIS